MRSIIATAILTLTACAPSDNSAQNAAIVTNTTNDSVPITEPGGKAVSESVTTEQFVEQAGISDMYEMQSSKMAVTMSGDQAVKAFAAQMVDEHTKTTRALKAALATDNISDFRPPTALDPKHQALIDQLKAAKGASFDAAYKAQQNQSHAETLALMENYGGSGDKPALRTFANETAPKVKAHSAMLAKLG